MKTTSDFLVTVIECKRQRLAEAVMNRPQEQLYADAHRRRSVSPRHALRAALANNEAINVIAEIKKASPSKGKLRDDEIRPSQVAFAYERGGAVGVSVLTEQDFFGGSLSDLTKVRETISLPVLRKDFIIDAYQLYESAAAGADAVLLITALLNEYSLSRLRAITEDELGMDALVEVHDSAEMAVAKASGAKLIGVNNRNLHTFDVSLDVSFDLAALRPIDAMLVSESGLSTGEDLKRLRAVGYRGFLIGEMLMRSNDPETDLRTIIREADNSTA